MCRECKEVGEAPLRMCLTCKTHVHVDCLPDELRCLGCLALRREASGAPATMEPRPDDDSVGDVEGGGSRSTGVSEGGCGGGGDKGGDAVSIYTALEKRERMSYSLRSSDTNLFYISSIYLCFRRLLYCRVKCMGRRRRMEHLCRRALHGGRRSPMPHY